MKYTKKKKKESRVSENPGKKKKKNQNISENPEKKKKKKKNPDRSRAAWVGSMWPRSRRKSNLDYRKSPKSAKSRSFTPNQVRQSLQIALVLQNKEVLNLTA